MSSNLISSDVSQSARAIIVMRAIYGICLYAALASATPKIAFPINSQVPPVVRVSIPFTFTFSPSTFSSTSSLSYALSNAPSWLSLDGSTRTLSGTAPASAANTAPIIQVTASDDTGAVTMNTTLVVSGNPAPLVIIPLEDQLESFGTYSPPSSILYYPSTPFKFSFSPATFGQNTLNHYAVTLDNTPLPAWIAFDGATMSFSGETPSSSSLVQPPQTWGLQLIASDVLGFSGTAIKFHIVVGNHKLEFKDGFLGINTTVGMAVDFTGLTGSLDLDGKRANSSDIASVQARTPDWLTFNNSTFALSGTAPAGATSCNVSVTAADTYGDTASAIVHIHIISSIFAGIIGSLNATIGRSFSYNFNSSFLNASDVIVSMQISPPTSWLSFDTQTFMLTGDAPLNIQPSTIRITLQATSKASHISDSQTFSLNVVSAPPHTTSSSTTITMTSTGTSTSTAASNNAVPAGASPSKRLSRGEIAAIVVPLLLAFVVVLLLCFGCYRRQRQLARRREGSPDKSEISNPIRTSNQGEDQLQSQDQVTSSNTYMNTASNSRRHTAALKRHSRAVSTLAGGMSMNLRDSRSSGTRGRSYSENALSDFQNSWRYTQDSAYPPLGVSGAQHSSARHTRNFSRKTGGLISQTGRSSSSPLVSTLSKRLSRGSKSSIQQTPDIVYDSENIRKSRLSRSRTPKNLAVPNVSSRLSGLGHGSRNSVYDSSAKSQNRCSGGFGHGTISQSYGSQSHGLPRDTGSWLTIASVGTKEQHRHSMMSALTESTEVLNSPKRMTVRQVPKSPSQPTTAQLSLSRTFSRPGSRRAVGSSPFFAGSSRTGSRGTSKRSLKSVRDRYLYSASPSIQGRETNNAWEGSVLRGLRDVVPSSPESSTDLPTDPLGISYGSPREGTRQLRNYMSQLGSRVNSAICNSPQLSDSDSRFRSAETSLRSQHYKASHDQEDDVTDEFNGHDYTSRRDESPDSFNRDRYGLDESPQIVEAMGAQSVMRPGLPSPYMSYAKSNSRSSPSDIAQERYMPSPGRPASSYHPGIVKKKSFVACHCGDDPEDGGHGAFL